MKMLLRRSSRLALVWMRNKSTSSSSLSMLPESHQVYQKTVRDFTDQELIPNAKRIDREQLFPSEQIKKMGELGLMAIAVPKKYGGFGLDTLAYAISMEEISRGCASTGTIMSAHNSLFLDPVLEFGNEKQKKKFITPYVTGERIGCLGLTEPSCGSDLDGISTTADLNGDHYVLNGIKAWNSNGIEADSALIVATTSKHNQSRLSVFIVPKDIAGFSCGKRDEKLGIRGSSTCQFIFEDCEIPKGNLLGEEGSGYNIVLRAINGGRIGIAGQAVGIAQASLELAVNYSGKRQVRGRPISKLQLIQEKIAEMALRIDSARLLTWRAAWLKDNNKPFATEASMAKLAASETATFCSHQAMQILGGLGYTNDAAAERHYRDARITEIYEGTSEIQKLIIAGSVIKELSS